MWQNFKAMPIALKFLTAHAVISASFILGSIIPHNSFSIDGKSATYSEWWNSGFGAYTSFIGIVLPIAGILLLKRHQYARLVYVVTLMAIYSSSGIFLHSGISLGVGNLEQFLFADFYGARKS